MRKVEVEIPQDLEKEIDELKRNLRLKSDSEAILYLVRLGLSVVKGLWVPASGVPPEKFWREHFPELPKPEPFWPRSVDK